jgi:hypothetical protein
MRTLYGWLFDLATLVFNPLTYDLLAAYHWRVTYCVLAAIMLVFGLPSAATFIRPDKQNVETELDRPPEVSGDLQEVATDESTNASVAEDGDSSRSATANDSSEIIPIRSGVSVDGPQATVISMRAKIVIASLWLCVSTLKAIGYYTPINTLVRDGFYLATQTSKY